jgi:hypothetical protein
MEALGPERYLWSGCEADVLIGSFRITLRSLIFVKPREAKSFTRETTRIYLHVEGSNQPDSPADRL